VPSDVRDRLGRRRAGTDSLRIQMRDNIDRREKTCDVNGVEVAW
jgi:hypothetical protein